MDNPKQEKQAMKIYVASSWRNDYQPEVVTALRADGHAVYDFKDADGFHWTEVDADWQKWPEDISKYLSGLNHPCADRGFNRDMTALRECDVCVYVMPCGVSASLEAGWACGAGKLVIIYVPGLREPDLMVKMAHLITSNLNVVRRRIFEHQSQPPSPHGSPAQAEVTVNRRVTGIAGTATAQFSRQPWTTRGGLLSEPVAPPLPEPAPQEEPTQESECRKFVKRLLELAEDLDDFADDLHLAASPEFREILKSAIANIKAKDAPAASQGAQEREVNFDLYQIGRIMHESWSATKRQQGYHGYPTSVCIACCDLKEARESKGLCSDGCVCSFFHPDLIPWEDLPEAKKDINRRAFDAVLPYISGVILKREEDASHVASETAIGLTLKLSESQLAAAQKEIDRLKTGWLIEEKLYRNLREAVKVAGLALQVFDQKLCVLNLPLTKLIDDLTSANERIRQLLDLAKRAADHCSENAPDKTWFRDLYVITGEHMVLTDEGWEPGSVKEEMIKEYGADAILDEVNAK